MMVKYKCIKIECPDCGTSGSCQLFLNNNGRVTYARVRHYKGKSKFIYCKIEDLEALKTLLKSQGISLNTEKVIGQLGQSEAANNHDLELRNSSLIQQNKGGRRLVGLGHKP